MEGQSWRLIKNLPVQPAPGVSGSRQAELAIKKKLRQFGFEATFFAFLYSDRTGPGSIPGRGGL